VELRVLGCAGGWPAAGRACSGYLAGDGRTRVWLDAGAGTLAELLHYTALAEVDALWISHLHPDHCTDLGVVRNAVAYGRARGESRLPVLGPPGWPAWFEAAVPDREATRAAFDARELEAGRPDRVGGLRVTPLAVRHGVPTFGCRIEAEGGVLAYSADSGPCDALVELARGAGLFLCEAFLSLPDQGTSATVMTPEQAGSIAAASDAARLLLTHLHPDADPAAAAARARTAFAGPVDVARPGEVYRW
jgi:ribonuclease BN (tRNA processing enzyme)